MDLLLPHFGLIIWTLVSFLIVFFILKKFAWPMILSGLNEREANIANSIASAEKVKQEMAQLKSDNEALLAQAREERASMLKEAKDIKDKMINDAKAEASAQAAKIIADANANIQHQKMAALTEIKNQVGAMVVEISEKILRKELSDKANQEQYISKLAEEIKLN